MNNKKTPNTRDKMWDLGFQEGTKDAQKIFSASIQNILKKIERPKNFPYKSSSSLYFQGMADMKDYIKEIIKSEVGKLADKEEKSKWKQKTNLKEIYQSD